MLCFRLQEQQLPDLNIICEKLAFEGVTRFEDRYRLPVSISVNCTAYAAKLLAEVCEDGRSCGTVPASQQLDMHAVHVNPFQQLYGTLGTVRCVEPIHIGLFPRLAVDVLLQSSCR